MGLISLFLTSFLAGSFVPMGSEAHFIYLQEQGEKIWHLLVVASLGNTFGGMTCYFIARWGGRPLIKKYLKHDDEKLNLWERRLKNRSEMVAIFCWLPFVGEIIAAAIGLLSDRITKVFLFMFIGKLARYLVISNVWNLI